VPASRTSCRRAQQQTRASSCQEPRNEAQHRLVCFLIEAWNKTVQQSVSDSYRSASDIAARQSTTGQSVDRETFRIPSLMSKKDDSYAGRPGLGRVEQCR